MCESQGAWYWPREGIQCNPYSSWIQWVWNAGEELTWLPLREVYRE